jgi:hypothetical protein
MLSFLAVPMCFCSNLEELENPLQGFRSCCLGLVYDYGIDIEEERFGYRVLSR